MTTERGPLAFTMIGGPTLVMELGGLHFLIDPTFSPPGQYEAAPGRFLTKTEGPAVSPEQVGEVDAVLLSHDQHVDNLDPLGRQILEKAPVVFTTVSAGERLRGTTHAMKAWDRTTLTSPTRAIVEIVAVPAQHGPERTTHLTGEVTGFIITGDSLPTVYVSGDNASLTLVSNIAAKFPHIDVAILFAGGAKSPKLLGDAYLTLSSDDAAEATRLLGNPLVVPVHYSGWSHFTNGAESLVASFDRAGISDLLDVIPPGTRVVL